MFGKFPYFQPLGTRERLQHKALPVMMQGNENVPDSSFLKENN